MSSSPLAAEAYPEVCQTVNGNADSTANDPANNNTNPPALGITDGHTDRVTDICTDDTYPNSVHGSRRRGDADRQLEIHPRRLVENIHDVDAGVP
jgi:hypothetical protein